jgi:hypothetical protein
MRLRVYVLVSSYLAGSFGVDYLAAKRDANLHHRQNPKRELAFDLNRGQAPGQFAYLARDPFGAFLLRGDEFVYGRGRDAVQRPGSVNYLLGRYAADWVARRERRRFIPR